MDREPTELQKTQMSINAAKMHGAIVGLLLGGIPLVAMLVYVILRAIRAKM